MLKESDRKNFEVLRSAFLNGDVALVDCRRKSDNKQVACICAVGQEGEKFVLTPFAVMVEGNPFEDFEPPK